MCEGSSRKIRVLRQYVVQAPLVYREELVAALAEIFLCLDSEDGGRDGGGTEGGTEGWTDGEMDGRGINKLKTIVRGLPHNTSSDKPCCVPILQGERDVLQACMA